MSSELVLNSKESIGGKCCKDMDGGRCICVPYNDCLMITAQITSILAFFLSYVWYVTFAISLCTMIFYQLVWCIRLGRTGMRTLIGCSVLSASLSIFFGVYVLLAWQGPYVVHCEPFTFVNDDNPDFDSSYYQREGFRDYCFEETYATLSFICAALWLASATCTAALMVSGKHQKWEERWSNTDTDIEAIGMIVDASSESADADDYIIPLQKEPSETSSVYEERKVSVAIPEKDA